MPINLIDNNATIIKVTMNQREVCMNLVGYIGSPKGIVAAIVPFFSPDILYTLAIKDGDVHLLVSNHRTKTTLTDWNLGTRDRRRRDTKLIVVSPDFVAFIITEGILTIVNIGNGDIKEIDIPLNSNALLLGGQLCYCTIEHNILSIINSEDSLVVDEIKLSEATWNIVATFDNEIVVGTEQRIWRYSDNNYTKVPIVDPERWKWISSVNAINQEGTTSLLIEGDKSSFVDNDAYALFKPTSYQNIIMYEDDQCGLYSLGRTMDVEPPSIRELATIVDEVTILMERNTDCYVEGENFLYVGRLSSPAMKEGEPFVQLVPEDETVFRYQYTNRDGSAIIATNGRSRVITCGLDKLLLVKKIDNKIFSAKVAVFPVEILETKEYDITSAYEPYNDIINHKHVHDVTSRYTYNNGDLYMTITEYNEFPVLLINLDKNTTQFFETPYPSLFQFQLSTVGNENILYSNFADKFIATFGTMDPIVVRSYNNNHTIITAATEFRIDLVVIQELKTFYVRIRPNTLIAPEIVEIPDLGPSTIMPTNEPDVFIAIGPDNKIIYKVEQWIPRGKLVKAAHKR